MITRFLAVTGANSILLPSFGRGVIWAAKMPLEIDRVVSSSVLWVGTFVLHGGNAVVDLAQLHICL